jgi:tRNA threonylcarbamoyl adenosine modification protein YeaZ
VLLLAFDTATPAVTVALHDGTRVLAEESAVDARRHGELLAASIQQVLAAAGAVPDDLTGIAVGVGPGPYTGLRAGLVTARVLGSALGVPVHGACTLDVIARAAASGLAGAAAGARAVSAADGRSGSAAGGLAGSAAGSRPVSAVGAAAGARAGSAAGGTADLTAAGLTGGTAGHDFVVATDARRKEIYWARYTAAGQRVSGPEVTAPGEAGACCQVAGEGALLYPAELGTPIEPRYPSAAWLAEMTVQRILQGAPAVPAEPLYLRRPDARIPGPPKRVTP